MQIPTTTTPPPLLDPATAPDDVRVDSGQTAIQVVPRVHLRIKTPTAEELLKVSELREALRHTHFWAHPPHREWLTDRTLLRFLIAREFNVDKALEMLHTALTWRGSREPYTLRATLPEMQEQGRTGKIYNAGMDRWGRPVVIFNNSVNNSNDPRAQMRYLAFNLETALRKARAAEANNVAKFVIFMHMYDFSLFNCPPFKVTRETIQIVTTCYPETMGHCVIYQPPYVFSAFYDSVKRFIDKRTASKIVMLTGDVSPGSANDLTMRELIGDDWRLLTGVGQPKVREDCSPGFDFAAYWPRLEAEEARLLAWEEEEKKGKKKEHQQQQQQQRGQGAEAAGGSGGSGIPTAAASSTSASVAAVPPPQPASQQQGQPAARAHTTTSITSTTSSSSSSSSRGLAPSSSSSSTAIPTAVGRGPVSAPPSPNVGAPPGDSKLWRPAAPSSSQRHVLTSIGMVAAASALSAAAAAASASGGFGSGGSSSSSSSSSTSNPLALLLTLLASPLVALAEATGKGSGSTRASSSSTTTPFPTLPGLRWLVPPGEEAWGLPGEGYVLVALFLLGVSILLAYPSHFLAGGGRAGQAAAARGEPRRLAPLPGAPTKTIVAAGRVLSEEARRLRRTSA